MFVVACFGLLVVVPARAADWSPTAREALLRLEQNDTFGALAIAQQLGSATTSARMRAEAEAIELYVALRDQDRRTLQDSRVQLRRLARELPGLLERPESQLSLGIAALRLAETMTAIESFDAAAKAFAEAGRAAPQADALAWLAEAWEQHGEWELTPRTYIKRRPRNPEEAATVRAAQIRAVRERVRVIPGAENAAARVALALARTLATVPDGSDERVAILQKLASQPIKSPPLADAALSYAASLRNSGNGKEANEVLERVVASALLPFAETARKQLVAARQRPFDLVVTADEQAPTKLSFAVTPQQAGTVQLEIRQLDLEAWLRRQQGRLDDAALPEAGSLVADGTFTFAATPVGVAIESRTVERELAAGPHVAILRGENHEGTAVVQKTLFVVDPLPAAAIVGVRRGLIAIADHNRSEATAAKADDSSALFWMHGSFVPRTIKIADGIGAFAIPPEAKLLVDSRWVCLIRDGTRVALLRGEVNREKLIAATDLRALLFAGPLRPVMGETVYVAGAFVGPTGAIATDVTQQHITVSLVAANEKPLFQDIGVAMNGLFSVTIPIAAEPPLAPMRVVVEVGGISIPPHPANRVAFGSPAEVTMVGTVRTNPPVMPGTALTELQAEAWYPWGTVANEIPCEVAMTALGLAETSDPRWQRFPRLTHPYGFSENGALSAPLPLDYLAESDKPKLLNFSVYGADSSFGALQLRMTALSHEHNSHCWLAVEPGEGIIGEPLQFFAGWARNSFAAVPSRAAINIRGPMGSDAQVRAVAPGVMQFPAWTPTQVGDYSATVEIHFADGQTARSQLEFEVRDRLDSGESEAGRDSSAVGTLVVAVDDEPRGGVWQRDTANQSENEQALSAAATLTFTDLFADPAAVVISRPSPSQSVEQAEAEIAAVELTSEGRVRILVDPAQASAGPILAIGTGAGTYASLGVSNDGLSIERGSGSGPTVRVSTAALQIGADASYLEIVTRETPSRLSEIVTATPGVFWTRLWQPDSAAEFTLDLPPQANFYRIWLLQATKDGVRRQSEIIDRSAALSYSLDFPTVVREGDRLVLTLAIRNTSATLREVRVGRPSGIGLSFDGFLDQDGRVDAAAATRDIRVSANEVSFVPMAVEVTRGADVRQVAVNVREGNDSQRVLTSFLVDHEREFAANQPTVQIRRKIWRTESQTEYYDPTTGQPADRGEQVRFWTEVEADFDESFASGEYLLIREQITVPTTLTGIRWRQRVPGNTVYTQPPPDVSSNFEALGPVRVQRPDAFTMQIQELTPGTHVHEYWLRAGRAGSVLYPKPEIDAAGGAVGVRLLPIAPRLSTHLP